MDTRIDIHVNTYLSIYNVLAESNLLLQDVHIITSLKSSHKNVYRASSIILCHFSLVDFEKEGRLTRKLMQFVHSIWINEQISPETPHRFCDYYCWSGLHIRYFGHQIRTGVDIFLLW